MVSDYLARLLSLCLCATLLGGCSPRKGAAGADEAIATVKTLHSAWHRGDIPTVHANIDYAYRLEEMLGDVWRQASRTDQDAAVALARQMLQQTTERYWTTHFDGPAPRLRVRQTGATTTGDKAIWIEAHGQRKGARPFVWTYRLHRRDGRWRVTQREFTLDGMSSDTSRFYPMAMREIGTRLGRAPSLAELNANLPSLQGRMRTRYIKIPELPASTP